MKTKRRKQIKTHIENLIVEEIPKPTMGTGRWYEMHFNGKCVDEFFISDFTVCEQLDICHENESSYEGAWSVPKEEYDDMYNELSVACAEQYFEDIV